MVSITKGNYYLYDRSFAHDVSLLDTMEIARLESIYLTPPFQMKESEDETKIILSYEDGNTVHMIGFDLVNRKVTMTHSFKVPGSNLSRDYSHLLVSNAGDFYLTLESEGSAQKDRAWKFILPVRDQKR
jgi:hypothetical protein